MRNRPKTLIILTPGFPENEADTTCLPGHQSLVKALNRHFPSLKVIILAFYYPLFIKSTYQWHNNTVISFGENYLKRHKRWYTWWQVWQQMRRIRKENEVIGIFSCWCRECAFVGKYFSALYGMKHLIWIIGQDARKMNKMVRRIRPAPQSLVAISDFLAQEFNRNHHISPQHVVPIGVDTTEFSPATTPVDIDVIGVGNLTPLKQYHIFIEVIKALKAYFPGIRAGICGKGPEEANLKALVEQYQLQDNVQLYGEKPHQEALQLMQRSRILLHPSSYEGFGVVMLEALYAGAQVVSFCQPMNANIPHWHIVKDTSAMVQKILELLQQPQTDREQVFPYDTDESAKAIMKLFDYNDAITS